MEHGHTNNPRIAVAAYNDGSKEGDALIKCIDADLKALNSSYSNGKPRDLVNAGPASTAKSIQSTSKQKNFGSRRAQR